MSRLTIVEAAKRVERSPRQIERYIDAGLPVIRVGRRRYVKEAELLKFFRMHLLQNPTRKRAE
ncbi:MAG: helix-turn-helix domain-containing protein [Homoserinimonas sp.]